MDEQPKDEMADLRQRQLQELQLREALRKILDGPAFDRMSNIRLANRNMYLQLAQYLLYAVQQGQLPPKISEGQLMAILNKVKQGERPTNITIKRK